MNAVNDFSRGQRMYTRKASASLLAGGVFLILLGLSGAPARAASSRPVQLTDYQRGVDSRESLIGNTSGRSSRSSSRTSTDRSSSRSGHSSTARSSRYTSDRDNADEESASRRRSSRFQNTDDESDADQEESPREKRRRLREERREERRQKRHGESDDSEEEGDPKPASPRLPDSDTAFTDEGAAPGAWRDTGRSIPRAQRKPRVVREITDEDRARALVIIGNIHLQNDRPHEARQACLELLNTYPDSKFCQAARDKLSQIDVTD